MHFWIDKRSQACGFNGRHGVPPSIALGTRRRNKPMVVPVHRFQSAENVLVQHTRRHQTVSQTGLANQQLCLTSTLSNGPVNTPIMTGSSQSTEIESITYTEAPAGGNVETGQQSQLMRLGGLIKYGMWASFGLIAVSVAVTRFFINHQDTLEMLLLCTLGMLCVGILGSCIPCVCRTKSAPEFSIPTQSHRTVAEVDIQEVMSQREDTILPVEVATNLPQQIVLSITENSTEPEQPPPPYHIAILLPPKEHQYEDVPPPSYENAMR